jgi:hypothetical protein
MMGTNLLFSQFAVVLGGHVEAKPFIIEQKQFNGEEFVARLAWFVALLSVQPFHLFCHNSNGSNLVPLP